MPLGRTARAEGGNKNERRGLSLGRASAAAAAATTAAATAAAATAAATTAAAAATTAAAEMARGVFQPCNTVSRVPPVSRKRVDVDFFLLPYIPATGLGLIGPLPRPTREHLRNGSDE